MELHEIRSIIEDYMTEDRGSGKTRKDILSDKEFLGVVNFIHWYARKEQRLNQVDPADVGMCMCLYKECACEYRDNDRKCHCQCTTLEE